MARFIGKWVKDSRVSDVNFAKLLDTIGVTHDMKEKLVKSNAIATLQYIRKDDNTMQVIVHNSAFPVKNYYFRAGEPFNDTALDGSPIKSTITLNGDNIMTEVSKHDKYGDFKLVRKIEGDVMECMYELAGVTMTYQMKQMKREFEQTTQDLF